MSSYKIIQEYKNTTEFAKFVKNYKFEQKCHNVNFAVSWIESGYRK